MRKASERNTDVKSKRTKRKQEENNWQRLSRSQEAAAANKKAWRLSAKEVIEMYKQPQINSRTMLANQRRIRVHAVRKQNVWQKKKKM